MPSAEPHASSATPRPPCTASHTEPRTPLTTPRPPCTASHTEPRTPLTNPRPSSTAPHAPSRKHRIVLDCDPGLDDAVAIMLALANPAIDLLGITTVGGNQTIGKVTDNARRVLALCRRDDVPVYAGATRPLLREVEVAKYIHGESGLGEVTLPNPTVPVQDAHAVQFIVDTVMGSEKGSITLVATGPLTNLALAARIEPRIVEYVREVVLMGGGVNVGNRTATAEFNISVDPEAAAIVFEENWPLTMVGLNLTHQALLTPEVEAEIAAVGSGVSGVLVQLMGSLRASYRENRGFEDPPVHDPCTIAYLIDPSIVSARRAPVRVETRGDLTAGMTVVDLRAPAPPDCHTQVAETLDHRRFWDLVVEAVRTLG